MTPVSAPRTSPEAPADQHGWLAMFIVCRSSPCLQRPGQVLLPTHASAQIRALLSPARYNPEPGIHPAGEERTPHGMSLRWMVKGKLGSAGSR